MTNNNRHEFKHKYVALGNVEVQILRGEASPSIAPDDFGDTKHEHEEVPEAAIKGDAISMTAL
jgi:hypothetical protein